MDIQKAFCVYDSKAEAYLQPFFSSSTGVAIRNFESACNTEDHAFHIHAGDYTLFEIGTFDSLTGVLEGNHALLNLGLALNFIKQDLTALGHLAMAEPLS